MRYRFGQFELDAERGELRKGGRPVTLQPKPLALLLLLVGERERVVPSDELLDRLWPDEVVTPSSLSRAISVARRAIDDTGRGECIRSYARRGYRFEATVAEIEPETGKPAREESATPASSEAVPLVGRGEALRQIEAAWAQARGDRGVVAVVAGPAGVGKTRLVEHFARQAEATGALVLRGRALEEEGEPAFWVWAQVLRALRAYDPKALDVPGLADSELSLLVPELRSDGASGVRELPEEQRRFVFFDAVVRTLRAPAERAPLLVVFEDLHWADLASARLLEHLAFELSDAAILFLVTTRDEPAHKNEELARGLATLRRHERFLWVELEGLSEEDLMELLEEWAGAPSPELARRLYEHTAGIPLFVREAIRRLEASGARDEREGLNVSLPPPQSDWIQEVLESLSEPCRALLAAAAVAGRHFTLRLLADTAGIAPEEALDVVDEAVAARAFERDPDNATRYRFVHDLFREAAYRGLASGERARLHLRTAAYLERRNIQAPDRVMAELAYHAHRALPLSDPEQVFDFARRGAELAMEARAYEQSVVHWKQALDALEQFESEDPTRRLHSLLGLGEAARLSGDRERRREYFGEALALARSLERPCEFANAAIGLCDLAEWAVRDELARRSLTEALEGLDDRDAQLEARVLAHLGYLDSITNRAEAEERLRRAVALAREIGASDPLEEALYALHLMLGGPDDKEERRGILEELRGAASAARDPVASVIAVLDVACDSIELGDYAAAHALRREADATAGKPAHPRTVWHRAVYDTGLALMEGRLEEVEERADATRRLGHRIQHPYANACYVGQMSTLHGMRGAADEVLGLLEPVLSIPEGPTHWVAARVARALAASSRVREARAVHQQILEDGLERIPRNLRWIATICEIAHCTADLEASAAVEPVLALLEPFAHQHAALPMVVCYGGPAAWALARMYALIERTDDAESHYRDALASTSVMRARPTLAQLHFDYGTFLRSRGRYDEARAEWEPALELAASMSLDSLERSARAALEH